MDFPTYIRPRAAAKILRVSPSTIMRMLEDGILPSIRLSRKVILILEDDLAALLASKAGPKVAR